MKKILLGCFFLLVTIVCPAQQTNGYKSLDPGNPIIFGGDHIVYQGKTIPLGPKALFIDGQLTEAQMAGHPYVFNSINKAAEHLADGTEEAPMVLYIAPYVYWIDNPDDPAIRTGENGSGPFGLVVTCEWLRFYGLSEDARNVVLACNRGQTLGSQGNFTMFRFIGQGTSSENITFGNYCNIDLEFPLKPSLNRAKRASAIVQAQLILCNGDKIVARNSRFVSRLNLCPFLGGKRVLFDRCHLECTDDALTGTAVYLNCTLDFYSSKPFGGTSGTGAVFLNCDIRSLGGGKQFFTKMDGQVGVVDTRFTSGPGTYFGWQDYPPLQTRNYQYQVLLNGKPELIGKNDPDRTVDMTGKPVLDAYRIVHNGETLYNTWNLLCGDDGWDPMGIRDKVLAAEKANGKTYSMIPVQLLITPARASVETGKNTARLSARMLRFGNYASKGGRVTWSVAPEFHSLVKLSVSEDGLSCEVAPTHSGDDPAQVVVTASTPSGLEAACVLTVTPSQLEPPAFVSAPRITGVREGKVSVDYKLDMKYPDQSLVSWYRCSDAQGNNPMEVAVSRLSKPLLDYELSAGDVGYYLMVTVAPKHVRCPAGEAVAFVRKEPISAKDVTANPKVLTTDFRTVSLRNQPKVLPGFWTWSHTDVIDTGRNIPSDTNRDAWYFGEGSDGAVERTGLLQGRSARMLFSPVGKTFGDMQCALTLIPYKTAGQGFSIAGMYMDLLIKFNTETRTGYALRLIRTTKYGNAVDCLFVRYDNGKVTEISAPITTSCYRPDCRIVVEVKGNKIMAQLSKAGGNSAEAVPGVVAEVSMEQEITPGPSGGFGIEYHGGSAVLVQEVSVRWE